MPTKNHPNHSTVNARELSNLLMSGRNGRKYPTVVDQGQLKRWVGIGWVAEGPPQSPRDDKVPRVVRE